jgi:hypothetical protein
VVRLPLVACIAALGAVAALAIAGCAPPDRIDDSASVRSPMLTASASTAADSPAATPDGPSAGGTSRPASPAQPTCRGSDLSATFANGIRESTFDQRWALAIDIRLTNHTGHGCTLAGWARLTLVGGVDPICVPPTTCPPPDHTTRWPLRFSSLRNGAHVRARTRPARAVLSAAQRWQGRV